MYYPDLTPYQYRSESGQPAVDGVAPALNVGWIDSAYPYPQGAVPDALVARLWAFGHTPVGLFRGFHECPFCDADPRTYLVVRQGDDKIGMGNGEIWVFGDDGPAYAAPTLIYHYVVEHRYRPPDAFIQAILDSPLPGSPEYEGRAGQYVWGQHMLRMKRFLGT